MTDEEGNEQRVQRIPTEGRIGDDRVGLRFVASLPSVGWRSWRVHYGRSPAHPIVSPFIETSERAIENEHLRIEFPDETGPTSLDVGGPTRLLHKASGLDFLGSGGIEPAIYIDDTDTWGHSKERFDGVRLERFSPTSVRLLETGPVTATVALHTFSATTSISHWYSLHAGSSAIDVLTRIRAVDGAIFLKLLFDTTLEDPETLVAALYDTTTAPCDGRERPGGAWKAMTGRIGGRRATLGISDTMTHGYSAVGSTLMLSLLRTAIYAHHEPHPATLEEDFDRMDVGEIFFRYRIRPIVDEDPAPLLQRDAMIVNGPPIVTVESPHDGGPDRLPREGSLLTCKGEGALVTAMKRETEAESGGVTTRLFDASGNGGSVHVTAADLGIDEEVRLRAHEVRTIRTSNSRSSGEEG